MKNTQASLLEKILLPLNSDWQIDSLLVDESQESITVKVSYKHRSISIDSEAYSIYDFREERSWRHLDLWHYKTYITARIPRYRDKEDLVKSLPVPWADAGGRVSILLEKKR